MKKLEITVKIKDEYGNEIVGETVEREVPFLEEFESQGFSAAFHDLETAVLETRKEASDNMVSEYLEAVSKKKRQAKEKS